MKPLTLKSRPTGIQKTVELGDTVFSEIHGHDVRIVAINAPWVEVETVDGQRLADRVHFELLSATADGGAIRLG